MSKPRDPMAAVLPRRTSARQRITRDAILKAARARILAEGHVALGMGHVAADAKSSRATLYRLFASKDHLLAEVTLQWGYEFLARLGRERAALGGDGRAERIQLVLRQVLEEAAAHPPLLAAALATFNSSEPGSRHMVGDASTLLSALFSPAGAESLVTPIQGLVLGRFLFAQLSLLSAERLSLAEAREQLREAVDWTLTR